MIPEAVISAARLVADLLIELVGPELAQTHLDEAATRRANAVADAAEKAKFGNNT